MKLAIFASILVFSIPVWAGQQNPQQQQDPQQAQQPEQVQTQQQPQQQPAYLPVKIRFEIPVSKYAPFANAQQDSKTQSLGYFGATALFQPLQNASSLPTFIKNALIGVGFDFNQGGGFNQFAYNQEIQTNNSDSRCQGSYDTGQYFYDSDGNQVPIYANDNGQCFTCSSGSGLCYNKQVNTRNSVIKYSPGNVSVEAEFPFQIGSRVVLAPGIGWVGHITSEGILTNDIRHGLENSMIFSGNAELKFTDRTSFTVSYKREIVGSVGYSRYAVGVAVDPRKKN